MKSWFIGFLVLPCFGQAQPFPAPDGLPIKRVVLYKNGVGYFEHLGKVQNAQDVNIAFTSGQLNDVLKSLTVLDLNGGRISGVGYGSSAPADRQLGDLRLPIGEKTSLTEFLEAIRGAQVEIKSGSASVAGRLLSVERKTRISGGTTLEVDYVSLLTESGEVRTTELSPSYSVRLLERGLPGKVGHYLDLASATRDADIRRMRVSTEGAGERSIFLSYISEVPVWKATYRIVLNSKRGDVPLIQGWAVVDNTVGQDWDNVELSLVAGAPQSFVQNLSQPFYARRPVLALPESAAVVPQTYEATLIPGGAQLAGVVTDPTGAAIGGARVRALDPNGAVITETASDSSGSYSLTSLPDGLISLDVSRAGFSTSVVRGIAVAAGRTARRDLRLQVGAVSQTVEVSASSLPLNASMGSVAGGGGRSLGSGAALGGNGGFKKEPPPPLPAIPQPAVDAARFRFQAAGAGQELGDLFEYRVKEPVTIQRNRSALVPIAQASIAAEKVSVWNDRTGLVRPQRALWLTNSTGLTLDGGSFAVLEEDAFAGEGIFDAIHPGERRLVSYAIDLALSASSRNSTERQRVSRIRIGKGILTQESEVREKKTYTFRNEDNKGRAVIVEHPVRAGFELVGDIKPVETTAGWMRFRVPVEAKQSATLIVEEAQPLQSSFAISDLTADELALFRSEKSISPAIDEAIRRILTQKDSITELQARSSELEDETSKIFDDQQRLRENMKALKGSQDEKALVQRYTGQLNEQENRLDAIRKESKELEARIDAAKAALEKVIAEIIFDEKL